MHNLDGYFLVSKCRPSKSGGGVALYLKNNLNYKLLPEFTYSECNYETILVEISKKPKPIVVGCVYRPPDSDISCLNAKIQSVFEILESEKKGLYILGDFNVNLLNPNKAGGGGGIMPPPLHDFVRLLGNAYGWRPAAR